MSLCHKSCNWRVSSLMFTSASLLDFYYYYYIIVYFLGYFKIAILKEQLPRNLKPWSDTEPSIIVTVQILELGNHLKFLSGVLSGRREMEKAAQFHCPPAMAGTSSVTTTNLLFSQPAAVFSWCSHCQSSQHTWVTIAIHINSPWYGLAKHTQLWAYCLPRQLLQQKTHKWN